MTPPTSQAILSGQVVVKMQNNNDADRFRSRKHPRLKGYDYATPNYYFVTICTKEKACIFGSARALSACGKIAEQGIREIENHFSGVKVDKYVVMPNHIHLILILQGETVSLPTVIGQYKSYVTRLVRIQEPGREVWQTSYHDHVIRDQKGYERIWLYIESNPANWVKDCFYVP